MIQKKVLAFVCLDLNPSADIELVALGTAGPVVAYLGLSSQDRAPAHAKAQKELFPRDVCSWLDGLGYESPPDRDRPWSSQTVD